MFTIVDIIGFGAGIFLFGIAIGGTIERVRAINELNRN